MKLCPTCQCCFEDEELSCSQQGHAPLIWKRSGTRLIQNKYRLEKLLGRGGMGAVYRCTHLELNHPRAIKLLLPNSADADPYGRQRMRREALTACRLNHPNLVHVHDCGTNVVIVEDEEGTHRYDELFLVMDLLEGQTLRDYLHHNGALSLEEAVTITRQVTKGLAELHSKGIVHRDLKPANIMLTRDYKGSLLVKIVDLGSVKFVEPNSALDDIELTGTMMVGSARYTSPENCRGLPLDHRSDIYCLGLILYEMLAGQHPFDSQDRVDLIHKHAYGQPRSLDEMCPDVPERIVRLVMSSLEKDPAARPQTATEFAQTLEISSEPEFILDDPDMEGLDPNEETVVTPLPTVEGGPKHLPSRGGEAKHIALALIYFLAFVLASVFIAWSLLGKTLSSAAETINLPMESGTPGAEAVNTGDEFITTTDVNIRKLPSRSSQRIGLAEKGSRVRVLSASEKWRQVVVLDHGRPKEDPSSEDQGWLDGGFLQAP